MVPEFTNEPLTDFSAPPNRHAFESALQTVEGEFGREWPLVIGGAPVATGSWIDSLNPCAIQQVVGRVAKAGPAEAERALDAAWTAFEDWSRWTPAERARVLFKAGALLRARKHLFSATMVYEAGKTWPEADGDTAEAIDFLEYYGREALRLAEPRPLPRLAGEDNELMHLPLGVGIVIPPWNFPLAITLGMTAAAIVTGNTTLLKPASLTPIIAARAVELLRDAGLPDGVVNFVPGSGGEIGDLLVGHARTRFISFTGSREVGTHIYELAARVQPGQRWLKRVVAEMGGKDAIIVDDTADLDAAAEGIAMSAYGFQGQKCSAASRAIVLEPVYQEVLGKVARRAEALRLGPAVDPASQIAAVIDESQFQKVLSYVELGQREGRLVVGGEPGAVDGAEGWYIQPTIVADVAPDGRLAQEEIFGPLLSFLRARDYDQALAIANATEYGLTGGVYSRDRRRLEQARAEFRVGNLYFNRKITGAMVGAQPFGGFDMSGTDSKAGGPDYLALFQQAKVVVERY
ncbi:MAG TPA: L-glutamate gamma-semialdehyde dehydrogenase [Chloroflexota bacterium]|nr:L-glutamate gamma-semialdehyde dehydrogenase [Chloroflexota bacterium]